MGIGVERHDSGVAVVTLSEEAARNAFSRTSIREISTVMGGLLDDPSCKAIVLTGTGRFFCTGADIDEFADSIDDGTISNLVDELTSVLHPLELRLRRSSTTTSFYKKTNSGIKFTGIKIERLDKSCSY